MPRLLTIPPDVVQSHLPAIKTIFGFLVAAQSRFLRSPVSEEYEKSLGHLISHLIENLKKNRMTQDELDGLARARDLLQSTIVKFQEEINSHRNALQMQKTQPLGLISDHNPSEALRDLSAEEMGKQHPELAA